MTPDVVDTEAAVAGEATAGCGPPRESRLSARARKSSAEASPAQRRATTVKVTSPGKPLEAGQETLGGRRGGRLREHTLQPALGVRLRLAFRAGGKVCQDTLTRVMTELSVHQSGESVPKMLIGDAPLAGIRP